MSEGKRKCRDVDDGYWSSTDKIYRTDTQGMSGGGATSSLVIGNSKAPAVLNHGTVNTLNVNNCIHGDKQRTTASYDETRKENGKRPKTNATDLWSPINGWEMVYDDGKFISCDEPVPGAIDYKLKVIREQLDEQHGSVRFLSTPNLIPLLGLQGVGEQPDCVIHYFVLITGSCRPVVFAVINSEHNDLTQHLRRLAQAVSEYLRVYMDKPVTVFSESICETDLNIANIWEKMTSIRRDFSKLECDCEWKALRENISVFTLQKALRFEMHRLISPRAIWGPLKLTKKDLHLPPIQYEEFNHHSCSRDDPTMNQNELECSLRIMGSERTLFFDTDLKDSRTLFGLEMAYRLNQDGGTLLIGDPGIEVTSEVCQEVVPTRPTYFNNKERVLGCKHVVVFADSREDLDQYKTVLRGGGKLLVFLCEMRS